MSAADVSTRVRRPESGTACCSIVDLRTNLAAMTEILDEGGMGRLEGLCAAAPGAARIRMGPGSGGLERLEARFPGQAFAPHRHDTYAIGITLSGVQAFRYRGVLRRCLPGQCHILHPDELHDGAAGTDAGFAYRIAYVDPALVQQALGGRSLPFVADPVLDLTASRRSSLSAAWDLEDPLDEVARAEVVAAVADLLAAASGTDTCGAGALPLRTLWHIRDRIAANPMVWPSAAALEHQSGLDRWTLA